LCKGRSKHFRAAGEKHFGGELAGKLIVSGGMGAWAELSRWQRRWRVRHSWGLTSIRRRIKKRLKTGYCDFMVNTLDEALRILKNAVRKKENVSVGLVGNCADVIPEFSRARCCA